MGKVHRVGVGSTVEVEPGGENYVAVCSCGWAHRTATRTEADDAATEHIDSVTTGSVDG